MPLTAAQLLTLKNDILADPVLAGKQHNGDGAFDIAAAYAVIVAPDFFVYRTAINPQEIFNGIVWANLTPSDPPSDPTPGNDTAVTLQRWHNRSLACQGKQFNVQILLQGQASIDASRANIRAGLQDALTNVPSGVNGATVSAGWVAIRDGVLARKANRLEKLFATGGNGVTPATSATMGVEGIVGLQDVLQARGDA